MSLRDELGTRMKEYYEQVPKTRLVRRMPVAIRIDGKAFHTFTKGFKRPFDDILISSMQETMKKLCENIQGCVLGYTQSDEITLILVDYDKLETSAWFDYEIQKICSISASIATLYFNKSFSGNLQDAMYRCCLDPDNDNYGDEVLPEKQEEFDTYQHIYIKALDMGAMFDSRCFNIPKEEVANLIYWRQLDASRNSVQMVAQANFSHKELQGKSCSDLQDMLMNEKGINWNDFETYKKRGSCCVKKQDKNGHSYWQIDKDIPIFRGEDRKYIEDLIYIGE